MSRPQSSETLTDLAREFLRDLGEEYELETDAEWHAWYEARLARIAAAERHEGSAQDRDPEDERETSQ